MPSSSHKKCCEYLKEKVEQEPIARKIKEISQAQIKPSGSDINLSKSPIVTITFEH
jgi:hypothetical protein